MPLLERLDIFNNILPSRLLTKDKLNLPYRVHDGFARQGLSDHRLALHEVSYSLTTNVFAPLINTLPPVALRSLPVSFDIPYHGC